MKPSRSKVYAALGCVFLLGALAGGGGAYALSQRQIASMIGKEGGPDEGRRLRALARELELTPDQESKVRAIAEKHRAARRAAWDGMMERCGGDVRARAHAVDGEIREVLTPEQQARFDDLVARRRERHGSRPKP